MEIHRMLVDMPVHDYEEEGEEGLGEKEGAPKTDYEKFMAFNANLR